MKGPSLARLSGEAENLPKPHPAKGPTLKDNRSACGVAVPAAGRAPSRLWQDGEAEALQAHPGSLPQQLVWRGAHPHPQREACLPVGEGDAAGAVLTCSA